MPKTHRAKRSTSKSKTHLSGHAFGPGAEPSATASTGDGPAVNRSPPGRSVPSLLININDPKITGLTNTFYSDAVGWVLASLVIAIYAVWRCSATASGSRPAWRAGDGCAEPADRRGCGPRRRHGGDSQLRPGCAAGAADPARLRRRHGIRRQADSVRPPRLRDRRQRRGGSAGWHPDRPHPRRRVRNRRHQPLRRARRRLDGPARRPRDRLDLQQRQAAGRV